MHAFRFHFPKLLLAAFLVAGAVGCSKDARVARLAQNADQYFANGEYEKAKIEYLRVLKKDPQNANAIKQLGAIWYEQGAPLRAFPFLIRTRELSPTNIDNLIKLAVCYQSVGQTTDARQEALSILEKSPTNDEAIVLLAESSWTQEDIDSAAEQLKKINAPDRASFHLANANLAVRKNDIRSAEESAQRALTLDPKYAAAHRFMGNIHVTRTNAVQAAKYFKTAAELAPIRSTTRLQYADFQSRNDATDEAKAVLKEILSKAPDYLPAWKILAQIALYEKKYDESLTILENIFSRDASNYDGRMLQAQLWLLKGDAKAALDGMERLNGLFPSVPAMKYQLARAYLLNTNPVQAVAALNSAISANSDYTDAKLLLAEINLRTGEPQQVVTEMQLLLKQRPDVVAAQLLLADAYRALGRLDDAAGIYLFQINAAPNYVQPYLRLGAIQKQQHRVSDARKNFEKALSLDATNATAFSQIIELDIVEKNYEQALQRLKAKQVSSPKDFEAHYLEARVYTEQKDLTRAEAALQKALELNPNYSLAYDLLVSNYLTARKLDQAQQQISALLAKNPEDLKNLLLSALIYEQAKEYSKASEVYEKLIALRPDYTAALNNLSYLYLEHLNQLDKAHELAKRARALQPSDPALADTLGWILYKKGEYQQSVVLLQESYAKLPDSPEVQFHLGMAYYMMGQIDIARVAIKKAADSPKDFPGKQEAIRRLALLNESTTTIKDLSVAELEELLKKQPEDIIARVKLGEAYQKQGAFPQAAAAYEEAAKQNPKLPGPMTKLAELNAGPLQNKEKAFEYAKKARDLAPNDSQTAGILGGVAYQTGNFSWAYNLLKDSSRQNPSDLVIAHRLAWAAYSLGKINEARESMQILTSANATSALVEDAKLFLAMTAVGNDQKSLPPENDIDTILKSDPSYAPAQMAKAVYMVKRGDTKSAVAAYNEILMRFPDFAPAQKGLAISYWQDQENRPKAYDLAIKARKTMTDDVELAKTLAQIRYQRKEFASAVQLLQENARKEPLDPQSLFYLGMSYIQSKDKVRGKQTLDQAIAAGLPDAMDSEAKKAVSELP